MTKEEITNFDTIRKEKLIENIRQCSSIHNRCDYLLDHNDCDDLIEYIYNLQHQLEKNQKIVGEIKEYINGHTHYYDDGEYSGYECEIDGLILLEILERGKNEEQ